MCQSQLTKTYDQNRLSMTHVIRRCAIQFIACVLCDLTVVAVAQTPLTGHDAFDDTQIQRIMTHGPWPQPWRPDRSNRVSGQTAAIDFGRQLFFDARLSPSGQVSCSSCHRPERAWSDGRPHGIGLKPGWRNTPSLYNVRLNRWFGWSGASDSLWAQGLRPLLDTGEMGSSAQHMKSYLGSHQELAGAYAAVFGRPVAATDAEIVLVDVAKALAAFQETIVSSRTVFDDFRDALAMGDRTAAAAYPRAAQRGLALFIGEGGCSECHSGPAFTNDAFHDVGRTVDGSASPVDAGRRDGVARLLASPYNLAGRFNDDPARVVTWSVDSLKQMSGIERGFRVPSLRNLTRTAPYMHDGSLATLPEAVRSHANASRALADNEIADLVGFLVTLSQTGR